MPLKNAHRFSCFTGDHSFKLVEDLCARGDVSQAGLLEVLLLGMEAKGADPMQFIEDGKARRKVVNPDLRKQRTDMIAKLNKLPKERLEAMLKEADQQGSSAS